ncbi:ABC transporter ATP-binding protein [Aerococcaceae bacterium DSM 111176]|nr:ABC transporter ATP-binding protein [Aerococcaceae bacterium DSM 111176]
MNKNSTILRIAKRLFANKGLISLATVLTIAQVALTVYLPILIGQAVNQVVTIDQVNFDALFGILVQMVIVIAINSLVQLINPLIYNRLIYTMIEDLRNEVLEKIHLIPLNYLDTQSTGAVVSRITTDTDQLAAGLLMVFNQFLTGVLTIVITIVTMARLDTRMMLIVVLLTPISMVIAHFVASRSYNLYTKQTQVRSTHSELIEEAVQQSELVRLFNQQDNKSAQFDEVNNVYSDYSHSAIFISSTVNPTTRFVNAVIYALVTLVGAMRIISGAFTVGELTTFLNYANQYMKPFNDISNVLTELQSATASGDRIFELIDLVDEKETGSKVFDSAEVDGQISFDDVAFSYVPEKELIRNLTMAVEPGQTVAIVGPTGAGKSTLINLLMRFYDVDSGAIFIDGVNMNDYTRRSVREQFGMVLQETWLKTGTIAENIAYGYPDASREQVVEAAKRAHAHRFIEMLPDGYDTVLTDNGSNLSMGQRQLLSISRLFVQLPEMLILDEATSSIDTRTEVLIQQAFDELMIGRTTFIIAHRLSTIQNADIILVMKEGQIIEQGNHEALMRQEGFYYQMQMAGSGQSI